MIGVLQVLGGLALFLYGVRLISIGMEKLAGNQIQQWLDRMTNRRIKGAFFGAVATALLQSSGLLMVTMIGLINANLMTVEQAIGVMLGQEIGTTFTAQIVAFDIGEVRLIFVVLGFILLEFFPNRDLKKYGELLFGLGTVFLGMELMSGALPELTALPGVSDSLAAMGQYPLAAVVVGLVVTSTVQSSTAVTAMTVAMGISRTITLEGAIGVILGANIGSCITGFIASLRLSSRAARQASIAQIMMNVFGVLIFLPFIFQYARIVGLTSSSLPRQIANAHTIFNISVSLVLFPFVKPLARLTRWLVPEKSDEAPKLTAYIDEMQHSVPAVALTEAARELVRVGEMTAQMVENSRQAMLSRSADCARWTLTQEDTFVDPVCKAVEEFINVLMRESLSMPQQKRCFQLKNLLVDVERVGDLAEDLAQVALERLENNVCFSSRADEDLDRLWRHAHHTYVLALQALQDGDRDLARQVWSLEKQFDGIYWHTRQGHIDRLEAGLCQPEADVIFTETLRTLERVSDHADNLGVSVIRT